MCQKVLQFGTSCDPGQPVHRTDVTVGVIMIMDNRASLVFNFSSLTTSHAGFYTCWAILDDEEIPLVLEQQLNVTFTCQ